MKKLAPADFEAWVNLDKIVGRADGSIPKKYRRSSSPVAVAHDAVSGTARDVHIKAAKAAGATREELVESSLLAAALRAGGAATHGLMALKFFDAP